MAYLITYEDALRISKAYKNFNFYATEHIFGNYKVVTFNYFLCDYRNFVMPLREDPSINALDMRGVTFVFNEDGTLYKRFLMLKKFFNVNQVEDTQISLLKTKKIKNVTIKEDGSLIAFMQLPNGEVFAKTQGGFTNDQSIAAMKIYEEDMYIKNFVNSALMEDFTPLFEYVAYDNRIVLKYSGRGLRFIGFRNNNNGDFYSAADFKEFYKIESVKTMDIKSLDELEEMMKTSTDMEGVVVEFEDGQLVKWKTNWYWNAHQFRDNINRENDIIALILDGKIDDFISQIDEPEYINQINQINNIVNEYLQIKTIEITKLCKLYNGDRKEFVLKYKIDKNFSLAIHSLFNHKEIYLIVIEYLKAKTRKLTDARIFLEKHYI